MKQKLHGAVAKKMGAGTLTLVITVKRIPPKDNTPTRRLMFDTPVKPAEKAATAAAAAAAAAATAATVTPARPPSFLELETAAAAAGSVPTVTVSARSVGKPTGGKTLDLTLHRSQTGGLRDVAKPKQGLGLSLTGEPVRVCMNMLTPVRYACARTHTPFARSTNVILTSCSTHTHFQHRRRATRWLQTLRTAARPRPLA